MDILWTIVSFILTLLILSFIFGDNPLFRLAAYLFVGVTAGYSAVLLIYQVIWPRLVAPLYSGDFLVAIPLALGLLLAFRLVPSLSRVGNLSMAYLVGAAAAVTIGGAVIGTLLPQTRGAVEAFGPVNSASATNRAVEAAVMLIGSVTTLIYFQFSARSRPNQPAQRPAVIEALARIGQIFIAITLGALFAGVLAAALTALIERLAFLQSTILNWLIK